MPRLRFSQLFIGHDATINTGCNLQSDLIGSRSGDMNPGLPGTKQPLCHLSYHPLTPLSYLCPLVNFKVHKKWRHNPASLLSIRTRKTQTYTTSSFLILLIFCLYEVLHYMTYNASQSKNLLSYLCCEVVLSKISPENQLVV